MCHTFIPVGFPFVVSPIHCYIKMWLKPLITTSLAEAVSLVVITTSLVRFKGEEIVLKLYVVSL